MEQVRGRASTGVSDPNTAEVLKPCYGQWCKRPYFHDDYLLGTFNRPNVKLSTPKGRRRSGDRDAVVVDGD